MSSEIVIGNITIEHNHGVIILRDAVWFDEEVTGYVVDGGYTSRLGAHNSYHPLPVGGVHRHSVGEVPRIRHLGSEMAHVSAVYC